MPPRIKITKDKIVEAAFKIIDKETYEKLTVRNLAKKLNCSTMPIYTSIGSVENLLSELKKLAVKEQFKYQTKSYSDDSFLNMGIGYILFCKEKKNLFTFLSSVEVEEEGEELVEKLISIMKSHDELKDLSDESLGRILIKCRIFVTGMAGMIANNKLDNFDEEQIINLMKDIGQDFVNSEKLRISEQEA